MLPDGKILAAGDVYPIQSNTISTTNKGLLLARFLPDGSPDPTFGNAGQEIVTAGGFIGGSRIALLPDGRFYVAGNTLGRFNPDGSLDSRRSIHLPLPPPTSWKP